MIANLIDVMNIVDDFTCYLQSSGMSFDDRGFPKIKANDYLDEWPELVVPYDHRTASFVGAPGKTVLCFYCADKLLYPRVENVLSDLPTYRSFLGVIGLDVTVTADMDPEWQDEIMLLNQLFTAVLAVNGVKVVANLRCGGPTSEVCLESIPRGVMCASGFLGCQNISTCADLGFLAKVLRVRPSKLILYGKRDSIAEDQLDANGIDWRRYPHIRDKDFRGSVPQGGVLRSSLR